MAVHIDKLRVRVREIQENLQKDRSFAEQFSANPKAFLEARGIAPDEISLLESETRDPHMFCALSCVTVTCGILTFIK